MQHSAPRPRAHTTQQTACLLRLWPHDHSSTCFVCLYSGCLCCLGLALDLLVLLVLLCRCRPHAPRATRTPVRTASFSGASRRTSCPHGPCSSSVIDRKFFSPSANVRDSDAKKNTVAAPGHSAASRDTDSFTLVSITHIPTSSGRVYDAEGVGAVVAKYPGTPATATFVALWLPYRSSKSAEQVIGLLPEPCERLICYETHCVP